jgi:hypothetical protein
MEILNNLLNSFEIQQLYLFFNAVLNGDLQCIGILIAVILVIINLSLFILSFFYLITFRWKKALIFFIAGIVMYKFVFKSIKEK